MTRETPGWHSALRRGRDLHSTRSPAQPSRSGLWHAGFAYALAATPENSPLDRRQNRTVASSREAPLQSPFCLPAKATKPRETTACYERVLEETSDGSGWRVRLAR